MRVNRAPIRTVADTANTWETYGARTAGPVRSPSRVLGWNLQRLRSVALATASRPSHGGCGTARCLLGGDTPWTGSWRRQPSRPASTKRSDGTRNSIGLNKYCGRAPALFAWPPMTLLFYDGSSAKVLTCKFLRQSPDENAPHSRGIFYLRPLPLRLFRGVLGFSVRRFSIADEYVLVAFPPLTWALGWTLTSSPWQLPRLPACRDYGVPIVGLDVPVKPHRQGGSSDLKEITSMMRADFPESIERVR